MLWDIVPFMVVALFWGVTNPMIEGAVTETPNYQTNDYSVGGMVEVVKRKKFMIGFGINQLGSVLYGVLLGMYDQRYCSLAANSLTTLVTFCT